MKKKRKLGWDISSYDQKDLEKIYKKRKILKSKVITDNRTSDKSKYDLSFLDNQVGKTKIDPPLEAMSNFTPIVKEFMTFKCQHLDKIIFFQVGGFFEMLHTDAKIANVKFDFELRNSMMYGDLVAAGFPTHALDKWIKDFLRENQSVVVVRQVGEDSKGKTIRKITNIYTPGTIDDATLLPGIKTTNSSIMSIVEENTIYGINFGVCITQCLDHNTLTLHHITKEESERTNIGTIVTEFYPSEIIYIKNNLHKKTLTLLSNLGYGDKNCKKQKQFSPFYKSLMSNYLKYFNKETIQILKEHENEKVMGLAIGGCIDYLRELKKDHILFQSNNIKNYSEKKADRMNLSGNVIKNLDLLKTEHSDNEKGSLFGFFERPLTYKGVEKLKEFIRRPLFKSDVIIKRQKAVEEISNLAAKNEKFVEDFKIACIGNKTLSYELSFIHMIFTKSTFYESEGKSHLNNITEVELMKWIKKYLLVICGFEKILKYLCSYYQEIKQSQLMKIIFSLPRLKNFHSILSPLLTTVNLFRKIVSDEDYQEEINNLKEYEDIKKKNEEIEKHKENLLNYYKRKLKVQELSWNEPKKKKNAKGINLSLQVNSKDLKNKKLLKEAELEKEKGNRSKKILTFSSQRIEELKKKIEKIRKENFLFIQKILIRNIGIIFNDKKRKEFTEMLESWSLLDVLICFYETIKNYHTTDYPLSKPVFANSDGAPVIFLNDCYHPCLKVILEEEYNKGGKKKNVVKNSLCLGGIRPSMSIISGPNMGGKTTILRSVAISVILAQMGMWTPSAKMALTPVDNIFTRIGANDRICAGESTFAIEMKETALIIKSATKRSLVILDELGRGTSVEQGESIAFATVKYLGEVSRSLTLFATHLHNLIVSLKLYPYVNFLYMDHEITRDENNEEKLILTHKIKKGTAPSFGILVAKETGIKRNIIESAKRHADKKKKGIERKVCLENNMEQYSLFNKIVRYSKKMSQQEIEKVGKIIKKTFGNYD